MDQLSEPTEAKPVEADLEVQGLQEPTVRMTPLHMKIRDDFDDAPVAFIRRGVQIDVETADGRTPFSKQVWQRGVYLPFRPFYEKRIERARNKAARVAGALTLEAA